MIIIPDYILEMDIPAEEKLLLGKNITIDLETKGNVDVMQKKAAKVEAKQEDWKNPNIGVLVGPSGRRQYRLKGEMLRIFLNLFETYGVKDGKRNAAWAFYQTIVQDLKILTTPQAKSEYVNTILKAARQASFRNSERMTQGQTPQFLQGWITARRWEDFE